MPNDRQRTLLSKHVGTARFAWNWALARRIERFEKGEGPERFTNAVEDLPLSTREWKCPACEATHERDVNAALNL